MANNSTDYYDYNDDNVTFPSKSPFEEQSISQVSRILLVIANVLVLLLGVSGNAVVIWIAGFKIKKTVNTTWYLSLAVSDFIFCAFLPIGIIQTATDKWVLGQSMCKATSFVMFLNMFSSIFLLVVISVDRYVLVVFPVWAQNYRNLRKASAVVVVVWTISAALSVPSVIYRRIIDRNGTWVCINDYQDDQSHMTLIVSRFVFGFVLPLFIIIFCYSVIILRLRANQMSRSSKPFRVMSAIIITFFLSWIPYHVFILLEPYKSIGLGIKISVALASANSCLNPFLYAFMGRGFKPQCWSSFLSKIKNTFDEDDGDMRSRGTSLSQFDSKVSTNV